MKDKIERYLSLISSLVRYVSLKVTEVYCCVKFRFLSLNFSQNCIEYGINLGNYSEAQHLALGAIGKKGLNKFGIFSMFAKEKQQCGKLVGTQAPVVERLDNAIHRIKHYPADSVVCFVNTYPLDSDLSGGQRYPAFEQPGPGV